MSGSAVSHGSENCVGISLGTDARERRGRGEPDGQWGRDAPRGSPRFAVGGTPGRGCRGAPLRVCRWRAKGQVRRAAGGWRRARQPCPVPHRAARLRRLRGATPSAPAESPDPIHCAQVSAETPPPRALDSPRGRARLSVDPNSTVRLLLPQACIPPTRRLPGALQSRGTRGFPRRWCHPSRDGCTFTAPQQSRPRRVCAFEGESELLQASRCFPKHRPAAAFFSNSVIKATFRECA